MASSSTEGQGPHLAHTAGEGVEEEVASWIQEQVDAETKRLQEQGARVLPVRVKNMGIVRELAEGAPDDAGEDWAQFVNRVECDTAFDFDKVQQVLLSEPKPCPRKEGFSYVNVILFTRKPVPLLLPYLYDTREPFTRNNLQSWLFVNNKLDNSRHEIAQLEDV